MPRPFRHPKTGVYWARKAVPAALRPAVGKRELTQTLRTKDPREARSGAHDVYPHFDAILSEAREGGRRLSQRDIAALCGAWYRQERAVGGTNPGTRKIGTSASMTSRAAGKSKSGERPQRQRATS
ncbi:MAG: DUF6538 domain-containing protein [Acetobacteraceae bacterium]